MAAGEDGSRGGFRPQPSWWVDAAGRDAADVSRDETAGDRDVAATARDEAAQKRDHAAAAREQEAAELVIDTHEQLDRADYADAGTFAQAERLREDEETVEKARSNVAAANPELAAALTQMQDHIENVYAALVAAGVQRDQARSDLRAIVQDLGAAAGDRQAADADRDSAYTDRAQGRGDRDNAATGRQQSAMNRAPRSQNS